MMRKGISTLVAVMVTIIVTAIVVGSVVYFVTPKERAVEEKKPIVIGHLADLTGALSAYGEGHHKAAKACVEYINEEMGGIAGRPVKYKVEDTKTEPKTGIEKFKRLVLKRGADFVLGSDSSGVVISTNPLAKKYNTLTFQMGSSNEVLTEGNRYNFYLLGVSKHWGSTLATYGVEEEGIDKWSIIAWDYSWGHSNRDDFTEYVNKKGGEILTTVNVPLGTTDMTKYVEKLDPDTEGVFTALFGAGLFNAVKEVKSRFPEAMVIQVASYVGIDIGDLGEYVNGTYCDEGFLPMLMEDVPSKFKDVRAEYRSIVGADNMGKNAVTGKPMHYPNTIMSWDSIMYLKEAIEETGWESKEDNPELIKYLEGLKKPGGTIMHPQGPEYIKPEDHLVLKPHLVYRMENFRRRVVSKIDYEDYALPPFVDFTTEELS